MTDHTITFPEIDSMGLRIDLFKPLTFSGKLVWGADIQQRHLTPRGNEGRARQIVLLTMEQSEGSPADLLRQVADLIEQGSAKITGEPRKDGGY